MKNLMLYGKTYHDTVILINHAELGETNECDKVYKRKGGIHNFNDVAFNSLSPCFWTSGFKYAYIISETQNSQRTSYVLKTEDSTMKDDFIDITNNNYDWLHISYVDDVECFNKLSLITTPYSLDFCTNKPRMHFLDVMRRAEFILDSRERKGLYSNIKIQTPIVLHDKSGIEIIINLSCIYKANNKPLNNLQVNGAGDIFAAYMIDSYYAMGLEKSAKNAMIKATNKLKNRDTK